MKYRFIQPTGQILQLIGYKKRYISQKCIFVSPFNNLIIQTPICIHRQKIPKQTLIREKKMLLLLTAI